MKEKFVMIFKIQKAFHILKTPPQFLNFHSTDVDRKPTKTTQTGSIASIFSSILAKGHLNRLSEMATTRLLQITLNIKMTMVML